MSDPISLELDVIHHITQAIQSLSLGQHLAEIDTKILDHKNTSLDKTYVQSQECGCGDPDCIEVCDNSDKFDHKLWKLVLLLGESYLALGQAYKEDGQLRKALKVVDLACTVYGSLPQHVDNAHIISSLTCSVTCDIILNLKRNSLQDNASQLSQTDDISRANSASSNYLFWAKAWTLLGDIYLEYHLLSGKDIVKKAGDELSLPLEVGQEVQRLKKKFGQINETCSFCSLANCSCQNDGASTNKGASRCIADKDFIMMIKKQTKRANDRFRKQLGSSKGGGYYKPKGESKSSFDGTCSSLRGKCGGIFVYIEGPISGNSVFNLSAAVSCYDSAMRNLPTKSVEVESLRNKKGRACYELGQNRLEKHDLQMAECAFIDAIEAFNEISDYENIILSNCMLGRGRRALAESIVSKAEIYKSDGPDAEMREQLLESAKNEYSTSLAYYAAARSALCVTVGRHVKVSDSLSIDLNSQVAHTYLRLGMLLARDNSSAEVYETPHDTPSTSLDEPKKQVRKREILADEAVREAISAYESLGNLRRQESAFAYFELASHHRDCSLRYLVADTTVIKLTEDECSVEAKQYASLAETSWQKSIEYYGPESHPDMYLIIIIDWSGLFYHLSSFLRLNNMLETALSHLLEARRVNDAASEEMEVTVRFWSLLRDVLKSMVSIAIKLPADSIASSNGKFDVGKLKELYRMSLKSTRLSELNVMHALWSSY